MPLEFTCRCGRRLAAREAQAGRRVQCPMCGAKTTLSSPGRTEDQAEPDLATAIQSGLPEDHRVADDDCLLACVVQRNGKATLALVLGLLSFGLNVLTAFPAVILARLSIAQINRSQGCLAGKRRAVAGLVLAGLGTLFSGVAGYFVYGTLCQLVAMDDLRQISGAMIRAAEEENGRMPTWALSGRDGRPLLSWRVALLPYLGQNDLYQEFKLDEPWDGPNNSRLLSLMPRVYAHPLDRSGAARGLTYYRVFTGPQTAFPTHYPRSHRALRRYGTGRASRTAPRTQSW